ncbi:MAG: FAD binding domain-containing protein [Acidimicrobiales bacterium]
MKPAPFVYHAPAAVEEAVALLAEAEGDGKVLAGGQSLVPLLNMRLASPGHLVDVNGIAGLDAVTVTADAVRVGATVRQSRLEDDGAAIAALPLLGQALRLVAHPVIRNRGTVVGSLVHADPAAELPGVLALLGGSVEVVGPAGRRSVSAAELFVGPLMSSVAPDEVAVAATFPPLPPGTGSAFVELARRHGDYALCGVAATVTLGPDYRVAAAAAAYIGVSPTPLVLDLGEVLAGSPASAIDPAGAARLAQDRVDPLPDVHATADYRRHLAGVLTVRALREAAEDAVRRVAVGGRRDQMEAGVAAPRLSGAGPAVGHRPDRAGPAGTVPAGTGPAGTVPAGTGAGPRPGGEHTVEVGLTVNGLLRSATVPSRRLLSDFLRHDLGLTGTHVGCEHGVCGCCTVLLDGLPVRSCLLLAASVRGQYVTTVEGLTPDGGLSPLQQAFVERHGLQCGFCTPGFLVTVSAFLERCPHPSEEEARQAIGGNLCRCTGYQGITAAVLRAAELLRAPSDRETVGG